MNYRAQTSKANFVRRQELGVRWKRNLTLYALRFTPYALLLTNVVFASSPYPLFITGAGSPREFEFFATSGWDGNWYVGYNRAWVIELPPVRDRDSYTRAFIGAKLGRAKDGLLQDEFKTQLREKERKVEKLKEPLSAEQKKTLKTLREEIGQITPKIEKLKKGSNLFIGISSRVHWEKDNTYFLVNTKDIPQEGIPTAPLEGVGEARWFWTEVPITRVNTSTGNYLAIWSPDEMLNSAGSAPIIASAWEQGTDRQQKGMVFGVQSKKGVWLCDIAGEPPTKLGKSISFYVPALGIKLVPPNENRVEVDLISPEEGSKLKQPQIVIASVKGKDSSRVWVEIKRGKDWQRVSRFQYTPPYSFTLRDIKMEGKSISLRVGAADLWENVGYSQPINLIIK